MPETKTSSPDLDQVMDRAAEQERGARSEYERRLRAHNQSVLEAHWAQAQLQADLADRAVAAVPVAVQHSTSWWQRRGSLVKVGFCTAAAIWGLEWLVHMGRRVVRGRGYTR